MTIQINDPLELPRHPLLASSQKTVLVPTMGALHAGHLALTKKAREIAGTEGTTIVSIFVNPLQFDNPADLENYPLQLERDLQLCQNEGVDLVFAPNQSDLYSPDHSVIITESLLSSNLCGASRAGHFDGVLTIVLKLFNLTRPHYSIFGKKDFQQLALIERMVRDLNVPTQIIAHPTIREEDGLAMSSRNVRLSPQQRSDAPRIINALEQGARLSSKASITPQDILDLTRSLLLKDSRKDFSIDYLELVNANDLQTAQDLQSPCILATACIYDQVRLIDHIEIPGSTDTTKQ